MMLTVQTLFLLSIAHFLLKWDFHMAGVIICSVGLFFGLVPVFWRACRGSVQKFNLLFWFSISLRFFFDTCTKIQISLLWIWSFILMFYLIHHYRAKNQRMKKIESLKALENAKSRVSQEINALISNSIPLQEKREEKLLLLQADLQNLAATVMILLQTTMQGIEGENETSKDQLQVIFD